MLCGCTALGAYDPVTMDPASDPVFPARMDELAIESEGASLNAILYVAQGPGLHPAVVLLHGFPGNERNLDLAQAVRRAGWNVLFFHYRGAWGSEGDFSFTHVLEDVGNAVALLGDPPFASEHGIDPERIALVGHSMGGFAALVAGSENAAVDCIASIAGVNLGRRALAARADPEQLLAAARGLDAGTKPLRGTSGAALVSEAADNAERFDPIAHVDALSRRALLLVAGTRDSVVPIISNHAPLVKALEAHGAPRLRAVELDADHAFSDKRIELAHLLVDWLEGDCRAAP